MPPTPKRIRKIEYDRIDRVDDGAQSDAHITLVKSRRVKVEKLIDPASIDAKVQAVRSEFWEMFNRDGCCYDCSGWVYVDAVYDGFLIGCDDNNDYWRIPYTLGTNNEVTFDTPEAVVASVAWSADPDASEDDAPMPITKAKPMWARQTEKPITFFTPAELAKRKKPVKKGTTTMPAAATADLDLSTLDDETRTAVEAAIAERDELKAKADAPAPEPTEEPEENLDTIEGLQKAISKSKSPDMKRLLKATLTRIEKAEALAAVESERSTRLEKAERSRIFKARAGELGMMVPHAASAADATDGLDNLAGLLDTIDRTAGSDTAEAVEKMLLKAHSQVRELLGSKNLLKSVGRNELTGATTISADPAAELDQLAVELMKSNPEMTMPQARVRVLNSRKDLYSASIESA